MTLIAKAINDIKQNNIQLEKIDSELESVFFCYDVVKGVKGSKSDMLDADKLTQLFGALERLRRVSFTDRVQGG